MAFPVASSPYSGSAASPAYTGTFIPVIWSGKLIEKFYDVSVVPAIANTDYEGEISNQGDKVIIRTRPTIDIRTYEADQALTVDRPSSNVVELLIDKGYYWNTVLDDVMEVQSDLDQMSIWSDDASEQMKIKIDTAVLATIAAGVSADNQGATAGRISGDVNLGVPGGSGGTISLDKDNIIDYITYLGQVLDEQNIPETGRWLLLPAWACAMIKRSDLKDASLAGDDTSISRNGRVGMIDRFTIYMTNLLPSAAETTPAAHTAFDILAGHSHGLTFASQISKIETLRAESTFGTLMRGLQVYGSKVVDGTAIARLYATSTPGQ